MAEARAATEVSLVRLNVTANGIGLSMDRRAVPLLGRTLYRKAVRTVMSSYNAVLTSVFPSSPIVFVALATTFYAVLLYDHSYTTWLTGPVRAFFGATSPQFVLDADEAVRELILALASAGVVFLCIVYIQRYLMLRLLLLYKGYLFLAPGQSSLVVTVWGALLKLLTFNWPPSTYAYQAVLPRLTVPPLKHTIDNYLESVRPLLSEKEHAAAVAEAHEFSKTTGWKLQLYLHFRSWWVENFVSDWWESYVYLKGRTSLMINSNYYGLDGAFQRRTHRQTARAAQLIHCMLHVKKRLDRQQIKPLLIRNIVPLCMSQYRRAFGTSRVPGEEMDEIVQSGANARHVVVHANGAFFKLPVYTRGGHIVPAHNLESQLDLILEMAQQTPVVDDAARCIAALTAADRTTWAKARAEHLSTGVNAASLAAIESALFLVVLDPSSPATRTEQGRLLLHGDGTNRWFDKSLSFVVFANARIGLNAEHTWADAPVVAHLWEMGTLREGEEGRYTPDGHCARKQRRRNSDAGEGGVPLPPPVPRRLEWVLTGDARETILEARADARRAIGDLDLDVIHFANFGKDRIKKARTSPDAFVQMAFQLAYYRDSPDNKFPLTYEASMTRLYRAGRTETVRSCSNESSAFVLAMENPKSDRETRKQLLAQAAAAHQDQFRNTMAGRGVDRHLFALYVVSQGTGHDAPFLKDALSMPWRLSTSQQPQQQTDMWLPDKNPVDAFRMSPGGGFGPVADDGYGVSYMVLKDEIFFHVSSKISSKRTGSVRFSTAIRKALNDIMALCDGEPSGAHSDGFPVDLEQEVYRFEAEFPIKK